MTDIPHTAATVMHRPSLRWPKLPGVAIGASLAAMSRLLGDALCMAYVGPYTNPDGRMRVVPEEDLEGRDPNW